jgi:hypothetical protein
VSHSVKPERIIVLTSQASIRCSEANGTET